MRTFVAFKFFGEPLDICMLFDDATALCFIAPMPLTPQRLCPFDRAHTVLTV